MSLRTPRQTLIASLVCLALASIATGQTIWYVDVANCPGPGSGTPADPFCRIQDAINAAAAFADPPDEILVADGIYTGTGNKNLDFGGKIIKLRSASGDPATCIIDCEGSGRGFYFHNYETPEAEVEGFTIRNGLVTSSSPGGAKGGGVHCVSMSSPTLMNCSVRGNKASGTQGIAGGGGVYCGDCSSPTLTDCAIEENSASGSGYATYAYGGGVYCEVSSSPMLTRCRINRNAASSAPGANGPIASGGGLYCSDSSSPMLAHCAINENTVTSGQSYSAPTAGGGLACSASSPRFVYCTISRNMVLPSRFASDISPFGGGLYFDHCPTPILSHCTIVRNMCLSVGYSRGGGIYCSYSGLTITNCTISGNVALATGMAGDNGGGIYSQGSPNPRLTNCILWGDAPQEIYGSGNITYCDIQGGHSGTGNINVQPSFAFADDFRLMAGSPCIDAGTNTPTGGLPAYDADGNPRLLDGNADGQICVDLGPYEFNPIAPLIAVSATRFVFSTAEGLPGPEPQSLSIRDAGGGSLSWHLSWNAAWLQASPVEGESTGEACPVTLTADSSGLTPGIYSTRLLITAPESPNSPRKVEVVLYVGRTLHVPSNYSTIQAGIDAATMPGDHVVLTDGVYTGVGNRDLDFHGKAISVRSASGDPGNCIIDCQGSGRGFYFHTFESAASVVEGLTIRNGLVSDSSPGYSTGGGVLCFDASPMLRNCTITGSTADSGGGVGFVCSQGMAMGCTISDNNVSSNMPSGVDGGGVYCNASCPSLTSCSITGNMAAFGGGVFCTYGAIPQLINCGINSNTAVSVSYGDGEGGGLYCEENATPALINCTVNENNAYERGGGVCCDFDSGITLTNCTMRENHAVGATNCAGGAVYCYGYNTTLTNCTINANSAEGGTNSFGGGVYCEHSGATASNCIMWGNMPQEIYAADGAPVVTYCDVQGGYAGVGNIDLDPGFAFGDDLHLMPGSPCIDAGTNTPTGGLPAEDAEGNARALDGDGDGSIVADMGAHEFDPDAPAIALSPARLVYSVPAGQVGLVPQQLSIRNAGGGTLHWTVNSEASWLQVDASQGESTGEVDTVTLTVDATSVTHGTYFTLVTVIDPEASNGPRVVEVALYAIELLNVPSEYATIQAAIDAATTPGDQVVVADGTYSGPGNKDLDFLGKAITVRSAGGNPENCIIDCEGSGRGFYFHTGETAAALVDGLTVRNGSVSSGSPGGASGGGVHCDRSSPTLTNCTIIGNTATASSYARGGGVYCYRSSPTVTDCMVIGNMAAGSSFSWGGGLYCEDSYPTLTKCGITGNIATGSPTARGGGAYCSGSSLTVSNCTISGNMASGSSEGSGGGVWCDANGMLTNCTINSNKAMGVSIGGSGGGVYLTGSSPTLTNCTISGNEAAGSPFSFGGGVFCNYSGPALTNCTLWGDAPQELYLDSHSTPVVAYCDVQGGYTGTGNIDLDPLFVDPDGPDNDPATWEDNDYRLSAGSPCIDAGNNAAVPLDTCDLDGDGDTTEPTPLDLDGSPRFVDHPLMPDCPYALGTCGTAPIVDMGAYEYQPPPLIPGDLDCDGLVGVNDIAPFVLALIDPAAYQAAYPGCDPGRADMDANGTADGADIQVFVDMLLMP